jgi:hypothetical protein
MEGVQGPVARGNRREGLLARGFCGEYALSDAVAHCLRGLSRGRHAC